MDQFSPTSRPQGSKVICTENNATTRTTRSGSRVTPLNGLSPRRNHHKSPRHSPSTLNGNLIKASWPSPGHNSNSFTMRPASFNPSPDKLTSNPYSASQTLSFNNSSATDALDHGNAILRNGLLSGLHSSSFSRNIFSPDHSSSPLDTVEAMDIDHQDDEVPITLDHRTPTSENSKSVMSSGATVSGNTISVDSTAESSVSTFSTSSAETKSKRRSVAAGEQDANARKHISGKQNEPNQDPTEEAGKGQAVKTLNQKNSTPSRPQSKKKAIYIVLHISRVQVGSLTGKATAPVKIYAEKMFVEMETDDGKETFNFRIPCKDLFSCKASLETAPLVIIARPSAQGAKAIVAKYREKDTFLDPASEDYEKRDIVLHLNYNNMPRDIKLDLVELFKNRLAQNLKWDELSSTQAKEILDKPSVDSEQSTVPSSQVQSPDKASGKSPMTGSPDAGSQSLSSYASKSPVVVTAGSKAQVTSSPIREDADKLPQRRYLSPRGSARKKLSFSQQPKSPLATASPSSSKQSSNTDPGKSSSAAAENEPAENTNQRITRSRRRKSPGNADGISSEEKPDIFHRHKQMENHISILGKHSKEQRENLHHHQKLLEEERAERSRHFERMRELEQSVLGKDILLNQQNMTLEMLNMELQGQQASVRQLQQELEQERESSNRLRKVQTDLVQTRRALDEEKVIRNLRDSQLQEKEASVLELQRLVNEETQAKVRIEAELRQLRDSYQLHQDELQNERISRQNRDRELGDKETRLQEQRQQLDEERSTRTGLEEELRRLRLEVCDERNLRVAAERELQQERNRLQGERDSLAHDLEAYERRVRDSESIATEYEQRLQEMQSAVTAAQQSLDEYRRLEPRDWIIRRDEVSLTDKTLGVGAWGNVVEGRFRGSKVAVKQIHELILSPHNRRLFEREMSIASRCRHPCLLQFMGATNDDGIPLFVTELLDTDLRSVLSQRALHHEEIISISSDIAMALNYLHLNRPFPIIHRDISSSNVLLWKRDNCWRGKLSDYGAANFMRQSMTKMPGARIYAAPEALTSQQSPKVDVYSFGLLLCEMCIRELPVPQQTQEQIRLVTNGVLRELVVRCVQTDPESRPGMADVLTILDRQSQAMRAQELVAINRVSALV